VIVSGRAPAGSPVLMKVSRRATAPDAGQVLRQFPPRPAGSGWPATRQSREQVLARLLAPPFALDNPAGQAQRRRGLTRMLDWLGSQPGQTWQDRWIVSGAEGASPWRQLPDRWLAGTDRTRARSRPGYGLGAGLLLLICGDVIRPGMPWLLASSGLQSLAAAMGRARDPDAFAALRHLCETEQASPVTRDLSLRRIAIIMAAKGGLTGDITAGDCVELCRLADDLGGSRSRGMYFYQMLRGVGVFPAHAPATSRMFGTQGQLSPGQMLSRYAIACRPVHDLIVDYLREQQLAVDHASLRSTAHVLGKLFWRNLEHHHPGIDSLRLAPEVAAGWKQRILVKTTRSVTAAGDIIETSAPRSAAASALFTVRAFYLDIAQWAADDPARWAPWAAPCPIRDNEVPHAGELSRRKARMDQRTRERLPALPVLAAAVSEERTASAARVTAARAAGPGEHFTAGGQSLRRSVMSTGSSARLWADDPRTGKRRDLTLEEHRGFWAWAAVEVLRHSGIRIEELTELSHHSLVQYRLPATGELIPLLQIAPSKTDTERLLVVSPELADVLSAIISRIRGEQDSVPLVVAYDDNERQWNPPMPLLFQRRLRAENRPVTAQAIRQLLDIALARTGLTDASGQPLRFAPHDFRRLLITDAIMHGMPPHIAQLVAGHRDINTTMGYKAVYPEEVINGHRAFIARRRALRPSDEYRTPTDAEWEEFLGHFERRRVALGDCGRAYGTSCIHEHSCIRCSLLRPDPAQRSHLAGIRSNLQDRITEAQQHRWAGEVEGLKVSLAAATAKLTQMDELAARRATAVHLGMPAFTQTASRTTTAPAVLPDSQQTRPPSRRVGSSE
jgi:Phage integrase family